MKERIRILNPGQLKRLLQLEPNAVTGTELAGNPPQLHFGSLLGESQSFLQVLERIPLLAQSNSTVLLSGETGTGKDVIARTIHYESGRQHRPFIPVNCAALPVHLCENELFGHTKGAFTDASRSEKGLVAEAEGGTLFLDEVDALSASAQTKLLRFLQDREYRPVGSSKGIVADVRIIAATNSDLRQLVESNQYRADLYYRLNVLSLALPPLRTRIEDIPALARHFLARYAAQLGRAPTRFSEGGLERLLTHAWPGNVRELEGVIERTVTFCSRPVLRSEDIDIPVPIREEIPALGSLRNSKSEAIARFERGYLIHVLRSYKGNITIAARAAGKDRRGFQRLLRKYGLERQNFQNPL